MPLGYMPLTPAYSAALDPAFKQFYAYHFTIKRPSYWHWSAGTYTATFADYHRCYTFDGEKANRVIFTDVTIDSYAHTYHRNTGSYALSAMCMQNATTENFGTCPPRPEQIELMISDQAAICVNHRYDPHCIMSHAEAASNRDNPDPPPHDNYGPFAGGTWERWDWYLWRGPKGELITANVVRPDTYEYFMDYVRGQVFLQVQEATRKLWDPALGKGHSA